MPTVDRPPSAGQGICPPKRAPRCPGLRPKVAPPVLDRGANDAVGRSLMHGIASVEAYLGRRGMPRADVEDVALECACLTYRNITDGTIALDANPSKRDRQIAGYMRTMAWRMVVNRKTYRDVFRRLDREPTDAVLEARTYEVLPALELASEIRAEPPKAQRFLLAMLGVGGAVRFAHEAAEAAGLHRRAGKWHLRSCRERAAKRLDAA